MNIINEFRRIGFLVKEKESDFVILSNGRIKIKLYNFPDSPRYHAMIKDGYPVSWHETMDGEEMWIGSNYNIRKKEIKDNINKEILRIIVDNDIAHEGHYTDNY